MREAQATLMDLQEQVAQIEMDIYQNELKKIEPPPGPLAKSESLKNFWFLKQPVNGSNGLHNIFSTAPTLLEKKSNLQNLKTDLSKLLITVKEMGEKDSRAALYQLEQFIDALPSIEQIDHVAEKEIGPLMDLLYQLIEKYGLLSFATQHLFPSRQN